MPATLAYLIGVEVIALLLAGCILFGGDKTNHLNRGMNSAFHEFKNAFNEITEKVQALSHLCRFWVLAGIVTTLLLLALAQILPKSSVKLTHLL